MYSVSCGRGGYAWCGNTGARVRPYETPKVGFGGNGGGGEGDGRGDGGGADGGRDGGGEFGGSDGGGGGSNGGDGGEGGGEGPQSLRKEATRTFPSIGLKLIFVELSTYALLEDARSVMLMMLVVLATINELSVAVRY